MSKGEIRFFGIVFFTGMDDIPRDIVLGLGEIRKWALDQGLITDPDFQLLLDERIDALRGHFGPEDQLQVALTIHAGGGEPFYLEYPYLPVKSLIRRGEEVELYYWRMIPTRRDANGNIVHFGETRFGFILPGCSEEICSLSTAKLVVQKLHSQLLHLSDQYEIKVFPDGSREITVDGAVLARFVKEGRYFDILLSGK